MELDADDAVLDAALAFIDDAFASPQGGCQRRPARRDEIARLRREAEALEATLELFCDGSNAAALWMQVANAQRDQRTETARENARLRDVARSQVALARLARRRYEELVELARTMPVSSVAVHQTLELSQVPVVMRQKLDQIWSETCLRWTMPRPKVGSQDQDCTTRYIGTGDVLEVEYPFARHYPFKLSVVTDEMWKFVNGEAMGVENSYHRTDEVWGNSVVRQSKPFGGISIRGPSVARRTYTRDGDVILRWSALTFASENESPNLMSGLRTIEDGWVRMTRVEMARQSVLVYVEGNSRVRVMPSEQSPHTRQDLERLEAFMIRLNKDGGGSGFQKAENRLLDATLASSSMRSVRCY